MAGNLKVFISYSHDSPEHKRWVSELAAELRRNDVEIIFDQWALNFDQDLTQFVESGIETADRVLVICTDSYVIKANEGESGLGYERTIVTRRHVEEQGVNKFIPIIRRTELEDKTPTFLQKQPYIDFTDDTQFEGIFNELLHERLQMPILQKSFVPHIESLCIKNYRALRDVKLKDLRPLSVFLGPNGSGKSTLFDVFAFLSECFTVGLRQAWEKRGRFKELRTRGSEGPIEFQLKYREGSGTPIITYHLSIDEDPLTGPLSTPNGYNGGVGEAENTFASSIFIGAEGMLLPVKPLIRPIGGLMNNLMTHQRSLLACWVSQHIIPV